MYELQQIQAQALAIDGFFVAFDDDFGCYGLFGTESGFCYALYCDLSEADQEMNRRNGVSI